MLGQSNNSISSEETSSFNRSRMRSQLGSKIALKARLTGLLAGLLLFALFAVSYHGPAYNPVAHGFSVSVPQAPDKTTLSKYLTGTNARMYSQVHRSVRQTGFSVIFKGWLWIDEPGEYGFSLHAIDTATMRIAGMDVVHSASGDPISKPVKERYYLFSGLHEVSIDFYSGNLPAFLDVKWAAPGSEHYRPIPRSRLFQFYPSPEERRQDDRFRIRLTLLISGILLLIILLTVLTVKHLRFAHAGYYLKTAAAVFVFLFLMHAPDLHRDHQYGVRWIVDFQLPARILTGCVIVLFLSGLTRPLTGWFRKTVRKTPKIRFCLGLLSVVLAVAAQYVFVTSRTAAQNIPAVLLYGISGFVIWMTGFGPEPVRRPETGTVRSGKWLFLLLFAIVIVWSSWTRFYRIHELPPGFWWDEAQTGRVVQDILKGKKPPIYDLRINAGTVASYFNALWCYAAGSTDPWSLRSYTACIGLITVIASWWFFRQLFSAWWSLFGTALMAGSRWLFMINRTAMATIDETILLTVLILMFYIRAIRGNRTCLYCTTGLLVGLSLHLHTGARVLPVIIAIDLLIRFFGNRKHRSTRKLINAGVLMFSAIVMFAPMGAFIYKNFDAYMKRSRETLITTEYPIGFSAKPFLENIRYYLEMYVVRGDWHPRHNYKRMPQLAPAASVLCALGFFLTFRRLRTHPVHRLLFMGFCLISFQGIVTVHMNSANLNRVAGNIPITMAWTVSGAIFVAGGIEKLLTRRRGHIAALILMICITGWIWRQEYIVYFHKYRTWKALAEVYGFQVDVFEMARLSRDILESNETTQVWAMYAGADPFLYLFPNHPRLHVMPSGKLPEIKTEHTAVFLLPVYEQFTASLLQQAFPDAGVSVIPYAHNPDVPLVLKMTVDFRTRRR
jgi:hypothetical protein